MAMKPRYITCRLTNNMTKQKLIKKESFLLIQ